MTQQEWLIDEIITPDNTSIEQIERGLSSEPESRGLESVNQPKPTTLAVRLQDIMIWDTKKVVWRCPNAAGCPGGSW